MWIIVVFISYFTLDISYVNMCQAEENTWLLYFRVSAAWLYHITSPDLATWWLSREKKVGKNCVTVHCIQQLMIFRNHREEVVLRKLERQNVNKNASDKYCESWYFLLLSLSIPSLPHSSRHPQTWWLNCSNLEQGSMYWQRSTI